MAIQTTRWSPDTCGCVIDYQWDDAVAPASRVHTSSQIVTKCAFHAAAATHSALWSLLMEENPRKNRALARLAAQFPILTQTDADGNVSLKPDAVTWSMDHARLLTVSIPLLTSAQKAAVQSWVNTNLGAGRVLVV